jgi:hypothetical protein
LVLALVRLPLRPVRLLLVQLHQQPVPLPLLLRL